MSLLRKEVKHVVLWIRIVVRIRYFWPDVIFSDPRPDPIYLHNYNYTVLRARDVYPKFRIGIFPSRIQGQKGTGSRIRIRNKEFLFLIQKNV